VKIVAKIGMEVGPEVMRNFTSEPSLLYRASLESKRWLKMIMVAVALLP
jgi:hypothetical protein